MSLPYVDALIADGGKYYMEPKRIDDFTEKRRHRARGLTLRSIVKMAVRCDSAEQLGEQLRRKYSRPRPSDRRRAEAELEHILGEGWKP